MYNLNPCLKSEYSSDPLNPTRNRPSHKRTASTKGKSISRRRSESTGSDHGDEQKRNSEIPRKNSEAKITNAGETGQRKGSSTGLTEGLRKISFSSLPDEEEKKLGLAIPAVVTLPQVRHLTSFLSPGMLNKCIGLICFRYHHDHATKKIQNIKITASKCFWFYCCLQENSFEFHILGE